jgi:hypothetical protein
VCHSRDVLTRVRCGFAERGSDSRFFKTMRCLVLLAALLLATDASYLKVNISSASRVTSFADGARFSLQFSYTNCGSSSDPIQVAPGISVSPSPIIFGQNVTVTAKVSFAQPVSNATAGSLTFSVQKHIGIWVDIPCSAIPGGCSYPNFCEVSKGGVDPKTCALLKSLGLPCGCPIPAGVYAVSNLNQVRTFFIIFFFSLS